MNNIESQAKYLSLYKKLRNEILCGDYSFGDKMPSKRLLASGFNVSVITVEHAYDLLLSEGYIEAKERSGYYCAYKKGDRFLSGVAETTKLPEITEHETPDNVFPFGLYAKAVRSVLSKYGDKIFLKCESAGLITLRREIAAYLMRSRGMAVRSNQIVVGAGAEHLYGLIVELLGRDKIYAVEKPSYEKIEQVYKAKGVKCDFLKLTQNGIESRELKRTRAQVLHITPYRSYPSKVTASASKRLEYTEWANKGKRFIVEDDFESEFTVTGKIYDTVFSSSKKDNVIYLNTFSKTVSPALRVAYMVLPESLVLKYEKTISFYSCTVPTLEQYVLSHLLKSGEFERNINRVRRSIKNDSVKY